MSTTPNASPDRSDDPSNVLLLEGGRDDRGELACGELVKAAEPTRTHLLLVTGLKSAAERLTAWDDAVGVRPAETTVVDVTATTRSTAATAPTDDRWPDVTVESVPDGDLLDLGRTLSETLTAADGDAVLCVDSVSDLLQSTDSKQVFGFLEVLTRDVERTDNVAHYHLDPAVHDAETVRTLEILFDTVVDVRTASQEGH